MSGAFTRYDDALLAVAESSTKATRYGNRDSGLFFVCTQRLFGNE